MEKEKAEIETSQDILLIILRVSWRKESNQKEKHSKPKDLYVFRWKHKIVKWPQTQI